MKHYLLSIQQPDGPEPPPELLEPIMRDVEALKEDMKTAGVWVFSGGLYEPASATVVRLRDGDLLTTDGPYLEGREHVGGITILRAPDLDVALAWGRRLAEAVAPLPVEVRPFVGVDEDHRRRPDRR